MKAYVIVQEQRDGKTLYFKLLALGLFWECVWSIDEARKFTTRTAASKRLTGAGKHREGWRVVPVTV